MTEQELKRIEADLSKFLDTPAGNQIVKDIRALVTEIRRLRAEMNGTCPTKITGL